MGGLGTPPLKVPAYPFKSPSPMITPDQSWYLAWWTLEHGSRATLGVVAPSVPAILQQPNDREDLSIGERCNMTAAVMQRERQQSVCCAPSGNATMRGPFSTHLATTCCPIPLVSGTGDVRVCVCTKSRTLADRLARARAPEHVHTRSLTRSIAYLFSVSSSHELVVRSGAPRSGRMCGRRRRLRGESAPAHGRIRACTLQVVRSM